MEALLGFEPVLFFITLPVFCTVSVSTTNETKSHFKAHFSLSFAMVSLAVVSLYFKCALKCDIAFSLSHRLASFVISAISHTHWCRAFNLQLAIFTNGIFTSVFFLSKLSKIVMIVTYLTNIFSYYCNQPCYF